MENYISPIEEIIKEASLGKMFILVDAEDRENEGDLVIPAENADSDAVNFMAKNGRGLICLTLTEERVEELGLKLMSSNNKSRHETAFTVSIEAREGVTTGISANDRALTISTAISRSSKDTDLVSPGHVFPIKARSGGVLVRAGHTEAAVDISKLAGKDPSGVICEIMNDDGTMARLPELITFAKKFNLKIGTIADLIAYRINNDHIISRIHEEKISSDFGDNWRCIIYQNDLDKVEHVALVKGLINKSSEIPVRVHSINLFEDLVGVNPLRKNLIPKSMKEINKFESGILIMVRDTNEGAISNLLKVHSQKEIKSASKLREYGLGAQILIDLGVKKMKLISDSNTMPLNLEGYDLEITSRHPLNDGD
jgi:3,4-dihydroxy 2-butanone 4-phosphate synthase/GTP cyclohydrolase II